MLICSEFLRGNDLSIWQRLAVPYLRIKCAAEDYFSTFFTVANDDLPRWKRAWVVLLDSPMKAALNLIADLLVAFFSLGLITVMSVMEGVNTTCRFFFSLPSFNTKEIGMLLLAMVVMMASLPVALGIAALLVVFDLLLPSLIANAVQLVATPLSILREFCKPPLTSENGYMHYARGLAANSQDRGPDRLLNSVGSSLPTYEESGRDAVPAYSTLFGDSNVSSSLSVANAASPPTVPESFPRGVVIPRSLLVE